MEYFLEKTFSKRQKEKKNQINRQRTNTILTQFNKEPIQCVENERKLFFFRNSKTTTQSTTDTQKQHKNIYLCTENNK